MREQAQTGPTTEVPRTVAGVVMSGGLASVVVGPVLVIHVKGAATPLNWAEVVWRPIDRIIAARGCAWVLQVIGADAPLPSPEARRDAQAHMIRWGGRLAFVSIIVLGPTIKTGLVRTLIDTVAYLGKKSGQLRTESTTAGGIRLLTQQMGSAAPPTALLVDALQALERALGGGK